MLAARTTRMIVATVSTSATGALGPSMTTTRLGITMTDAGYRGHRAMGNWTLVEVAA
jgi:hypothetical protein